MAIRKFVAQTTREAMMQVRRELGDDAVIIANKRIGNRIEILAAAPDAVDALVERSESRAAAPAREPVAARATRTEARPQAEPFQDFIRRQMNEPAEGAAPRPARETRAAQPRPNFATAERAGAPQKPLSNKAGVAMYYDIADIDEEESIEETPRTIERARRAPAAAPATAQPRTPSASPTLPHGHRSQQVEAAPGSDPAVFRRRPAQVAPVRAENLKTAPAARAVDIELEPQPAAPAAIVTAAPAMQAVAAPVPPVASAATPSVEPVAAGHASVPSLPVRSQAGPIATAARLREASINAAQASVPTPAIVAAAPAPVAAPVESAPAARVAPAEESVAVIAPAIQMLPIDLGLPVVAAPPAHAVAKDTEATAGAPAMWSWEAQGAAAVAAPAAAPVAAAPQAVSPAPAAPAQAAPVQAESQLLAELQSMRDMLREQLASLATKPAPAVVTAQPAQPGAAATRVTTRLLSAGFSVEVARRIATYLPQGTQVAQAEAWLEEVLAHNIRCADASDGIVERAGQPGMPGQIYALVGPTGVGKTTTVAKLAARFAVRHGTSALGLITLDAYRVAAPEQLRTYGRILGTPVHLAQDSATLRELLATMVHKRLVLIDTCGVSQRDERLGEMLDLLANAGTAARPIHRVLLLNSASHAETLDETARAWRANECAGAILTKLDEATRIGGSLDVSLRHRLTLVGLTNGQRVPEDWHAAGSKLLAHLALKPAAQLFDLADEEGAALAAQAPQVAAHGSAHG